MHRSIQPEIGHWYKSPEIPEYFEVVAIDEQSHHIEIQLFDGDLEEFDFEEWKILHIDEIEEPEDWSAPYEIEPEDLRTLQNDDKPFHPEDWTGPVNWIEPE